MKKKVSLEEKPRDFFLLELVLVPAIFAIALVYVAIMGPSILSRQKLESESGFLNFISAEVSKSFAAFPNYQGLNNTVMINSGDIPKDKIISATEIGHIYGGRVYFGYNGANPRQWVLIYQDIPKKVCIELAKRFRPDNLSAVYIITTDITPAANGAVNLPGAGRVSATDTTFITQVNTLCSAAEKVNIAWVLR